MPQRLDGVAYDRPVDTAYATVKVEELPNMDAASKEPPLQATSSPPTAASGVAGASREGSGLEQKQLPPVPYLSLYRFADRWDQLVMLLGLVGSAANGAALPLFALVFGELINGFGNNQGTGRLADEVNKVILYFVYLAIGAFIASYAEVGLWMLTGQRQANRWRQQYFCAVLRQEIAFFDVDTTSGSLLQSLNSDTVAVQNAIGEKVGNFIHHMCTFVVGISIAFWRGWDMTLVLLAVTPVLALVGGLVAVVMGRLGTKASAAYAAANGFALEAFANIRTVVAFGGEERTLTRYAKALVLPEAVGIRAGFFNGLTLGTTNCVFLCAYGLALWYGGKRVRDGAYNGGDVMQVLFAALMGGFALGQAAPNLQYFKTGQEAAARLTAILKRVPAIRKEDPPGQQPPQVAASAVELKAVEFAYPARPDVSIFKHFSLTIPAGSTTALVGPSGSGKSTVVALIARFYDPLSGQVLLEGVDLRALDLAALRRRIGHVGQEPTLFATTVAANIAYGRPGASQEEVEAAARAANAHTFISALPQGYDTHVGEKGVQMSGGQKQRIAIARAMLRNPAILLLDEATSALDAESERVVQAALDKLSVGRTTLVVAHRLSTIRHVDSIAVVRGGQVVEQGSHAQLLAAPGSVYASLIQLQQAGQDAELPGQESPDQATQQRDGGGGGRAAALSVAGSRRVVDRRSSSLKEPASLKPRKRVGFLRLARLNRPEAHWGLLGCTASGVMGCLMPSFALSLSSIIAVFYYTDKARMERDTRTWVLVFVGTGLAALVAATLQQFSFTLMGQRLTRRTRTMVMRSVLHQEIGWFDKEENSSGALTSRLETDTVNIRGAVGDQAGLIVQNIVTVVAGYTIAFTAGWRMTLVVTAVVPLIAIAGWIQGKFMVGFSSQAEKLFSQANQTASEAFSSMRTVAAFDLEGPLGALYARQLAPPAAAGAKRAHASGIGFGFSQAVMFAVYALAFWYGGRLVDSGEMSFEDMLKVFFAIILAAFGASQAQMAFPDITKASGAVKRVFEVVDRQSLINAADEEGEMLDKVGDVELHDVTFAYPARPAAIVLKGFSLRVPAGATVALVGSSGSGKSTVIGLVLRLYDVLDGAVLVGGVDVRDLRLSALRGRLGLVSQQPALFSATIADNIAYGRAGASLEEIEAAARAANAHDFIVAQPGGYHTQVGEGGVQLSGGQKQRVAIARAILRNPDVLLLDEATSALDSASEHLVQQALDKLSAQRTTLVVAHRLSTIRHADTIAVVQSGSIVEAGRHEELLRRTDGAYAALIRHQHQP